jgi:hypothetical protein
MKKEEHQEPPSRRREEDELWRMDFTKKQGMADENSDLEVPWGLLLGIYQMGIPTT